MAFNSNYLASVSTSANTQGLKVWTYNGTSTGSNEAIATIVASGYFNSFMQKLSAGEGPFQLGDVMHVHGNDSSGMYIIDSITTNVEMSSYAAIGAVDTAQLVNDAVTQDKLADNAVGNAQMRDDAVDSAEIADGAVDNVHLAEDVIQYAEVTVSTAEMKDLVANQKELVAAPGADKVIQFLGAEFVLDYNSAAYTESGDNMAIRYTDGSGAIVSETIEATGFVDQTADTLTNAIPKKDAIVAASGAVNKALVLDNTGSNYAAGDSPVYVKVTYKVITAGL